MMRIIVLALVLVGCESERIAQCGYACRNTGGQMTGYSAASGCTCSVGPACADGGKP